jgi:hypothetical protein
MEKDITITCKDCGQEFAFTAGEQEFYASKNLPDPEYCLICRGKYKAMQKDAGKYGKAVDKVEEIRR